MRALLLALAACAHAPAAAPAPAAASSSPHNTDFDFEIGNWHTHLKVLDHPLTGSTTWIEMDGTSAIRKVWDGRANLVELEVLSPSGKKIEGLSLRLFDPVKKTWSLNYANASMGTMTAPAVGTFKDGRGEFYDQETLGDRAIFVRFIFSDITPNTFKLEQAFSGDGGKTWEANWLATFTKVAP